MLADGFDVTVVGGVARVAGEIDMVSAPAFDRALTALPDRLELDLEAITFLDSAGISVIVRHHRPAVASGSCRCTAKGNIVGIDHSTGSLARISCPGRRRDRRAKVGFLVLLPAGIGEGVLPWGLEWRLWWWG
jgi:hypothetical protein